MTQIMAISNAKRETSPYFKPVEWVQASREARTYPTENFSGTPSELQASRGARRIQGYLSSLVKQTLVHLIIYHQTKKIIQFVTQASREARVTPYVPHPPRPIYSSAYYIYLLLPQLANDIHLNPGPRPK